MSELTPWVAPEAGPRGKVVRIWRCEVFSGPTPGSGNRALVLAAPEALPRHDFPVVVAFSEDDPPQVRFCAPLGTLAFCGHGALAAAKVIAFRRGTSELTMLTPSQRVEARIEDEMVSILLPRPRLALAVDADDALSGTLGLASPRRIFLTDAGSPKWLVEVDPGEIETLSVDLAGLEHLSARYGVNGAYVFARGTAGGVRARAFNPLASVAEDRATGVAVAALAACLGERITVEQGPPEAVLAQLQAWPEAGGIVLRGRVELLAEGNL